MKPETKLSDIFIKSPALLEDETKLKNVLSDFFSGDEPKVRRMIKAYEIGTFSCILSGKADDFEKKKLIDKLVNSYDMQESKAIDAVDGWFTACTPTVVKTFREYREKQEKLATMVELKAKTERDIAAKNEAEKQREREKSILDGSDHYEDNRANYDRYINVDLSKKNGLVTGIPCGVGNSDYGFEIIGAGRAISRINSYDEAFYPSVIALVYNFLIRNTHITKEAYPQYLKSHHFNHELNYGHVYRFIMILLELVKSEEKTELKLNVIGDKQELLAAVDILNEYLAVFGRLTRTKISSLVYIDDPKGRSISVDSTADICVCDYKENQGLYRRIRYGNRINYSLGKEDKTDLEFILREISPFKSFKKGQFDALCSVLNANSHAVCIMPTGSGKSLIYYFACILQPQTVFVVAPTDILIKDQIRNLENIHHFDNVTHLLLREGNDYSFYRPGTNLVYLTPTTFQNRNLFGIFKRFGDKISYVVLDEIHCISNWGHDFRPEYLMLSQNMEKYLDKARYLGFTATANYTVAQDIQKQLGIPIENLFSPIMFEKYNIRYDFRECKNKDDMLREVKKIADDIIRRNEKAIVFTKNDMIAKTVAEVIGYEADVFTNDHPNAYDQFAAGLCRILVSTEDLGIGINLPNITCTVHYGLPLSKNEFVQEIGRAGRADEKVTSYVIYLKATDDNIPAQLLKRETTIDNLPQVLKNMNNDYSDIFHKLNCGADTSDILYERLFDVYTDFHNSKKVAYIIDYPVNRLEIYKRYLYMLYITGYIKNWYTYCAIGEDKITIIIDICDIPHASGLRELVMEDYEMLERMKQVSRNYFASMGNDRESIYNIQWAKKPEDILKVYVKWYYNKFLYHHKEQFLDFYEFITNNINRSDQDITEEIEDYFVLPFVKIKEDEEYYTNMTFDEISKQVTTGVGKNTLANLERINSNSYSYTLDYLLFLGNWSRNERFEVKRLERFWNKLSKKEKDIFWGTLKALYKDCTNNAKLSCLRYFDDKYNVTEMNFQNAIKFLYEDTSRDIIYYGIMASRLNLKLDFKKR